MSESTDDAADDQASADGVLAQATASIVALSHRLQELREVRQRLELLERDAEQLLVTELHTTGIRTYRCNNMVFTMRSGAKRTQWDRDGLQNAVLVKVLADHGITNQGDAETGEMIRVSHVDQLRELSKTFGRVFRMEPRATALRAIGVSVDGYCSTDYGSSSVKIEPLPAVLNEPDHTHQMPPRGRL